ncbi:hypothetical protein VTL71DRAFT_13833 [Oculimacula yallundae]|uniref:Uncharacterized protein n=1 Tax=Oculimacula yallundae TaxID=86028 RepID=A0ABR4CLH4_9HELO
MSWTPFKGMSLRSLFQESQITTRIECEPPTDKTAVRTSSHASPSIVNVKLDYHYLKSKDITQIHQYRICSNPHHHCTSKFNISTFCNVLKRAGHQPPYSVESNNDTTNKTGLISHPAPPALQGIIYRIRGTFQPEKVVEHIFSILITFLSQ